MDLLYIGDVELIQHRGSQHVKVTKPFTVGYRGVMNTYVNSCVPIGAAATIYSLVLPFACGVNTVRSFLAVAIKDNCQA